MSLERRLDRLEQHTPPATCPVCGGFPRLVFQVVNPDGQARWLDRDDTPCPGCGRPPEVVVFRVVPARGEAS